MRKDHYANSAEGSFLGKDPCVKPAEPSSSSRIRFLRTPKRSEGSRTRSRDAAWGDRTEEFAWGAREIVTKTPSRRWWSQEKHTRGADPREETPEDSRGPPLGSRPLVSRPFRSRRPQRRRVPPPLWGRTRAGPTWAEASPPRPPTPLSADNTRASRSTQRLPEQSAVFEHLLAVKRDVVYSRVRGR